MMRMAKWKNLDIGEGQETPGNPLRQFLVEPGEAENELAGELRPGQDGKEWGEVYASGLSQELSWQ